MTVINYPDKKVLYSPHGNNWNLFVKKFFKKDSEFSFRTIYAFGNKVSLKRELKAQLSQRDGYYYLDNEYLDIHCIGDSENEVKQEFFEMFLADKENYYDCDENELSLSGLEQRHRIARFL